MYQAKIYIDDPEVSTRTKIGIELLDVNSNSVFQKQLNANNGFAIHIIPK